MTPTSRVEAVLGGAAMGEVTSIGRWLRRTRIDELPQLYNLLRGEMVFVGPRPPLPRYVDAYPEVYLPLLTSPPGITGLATVVYCRREEVLLSTAAVSEDVDRVYRQRCLPRKARLDRVYKNRRGPGLVFLVLILTLWRSPASHRVVRRLRHGIERFGGQRP